MATLEEAKDGKLLVKPSVTILETSVLIITEMMRTKYEVSVWYGLDMKPFMSPNWHSQLLHHNMK